MYKEPGACVARFFLRPDDLFEFRHPLQPDRERLAREGIELLDADHRRVGEARGVTRFHQVVTDLARTEDDALDVLVGGRRAVRHDAARSEEHTSELQSLMRISYAVFCLKKKKKQ